MIDTVVVGGGPAGSRTAALLARDHDVLVLEEHETSGVPMQCAGLISDDVIRMSGVSPDILNTLYGAEVVFPDGTSVIVRSKRPKARAVDRSDLDSKMAAAAMDAGAEFSYSDRCSKVVFGGDSVSVKSTKAERSCRCIVGADGHSSMVSASLGDNQPKEYLRGIQADVRVELDNQDLFRIHLGSEYAPGFFTWEIPCGEFTRAGLCTSWSAGPPNDYLKHLLRSNGGEDRIIRRYCGKIPVGGRRTMYGDRCLLIGDAACHVKPVSGGGLHPAFKAAPILADVLTDALASDDLSAKTLSSYEKRCRSDFVGELNKGMMLRRMFVRLSDDDLIHAGRYASRDDVRAILDEIDLDHPSTVVREMFRRPAAAVSAVPLLLRCLF